MKTLQQTYRLDCLPSDNPYLSDNWRPCHEEWTASTPDLEVIGEVPRDLNDDQRRTKSVIHTLGIVAIAIYIAEAVFAIFRIT